MMPPPNRFDDYPDLQAPLAKWHDLEESFDTATECHDALAKHIESFNADMDGIATLNALKETHAFRRRQPTGNGGTGVLA